MPTGVESAGCSTIGVLVMGASFSSSVGGCSLVGAVHETHSICCSAAPSLKFKSLVGRNWTVPEMCACSSAALSLKFKSDEIFAPLVTSSSDKLHASSCSFQAFYHLNSSHSGPCHFLVSGQKFLKTVKMSLLSIDVECRPRNEKKYLLDVWLY